jgi:hypothetical protein
MSHSDEEYTSAKRLRRRGLRMIAVFIVDVRICVEKKGITCGELGALSIQQSLRMQDV